MQVDADGQIVATSLFLHITWRLALLGVYIEHFNVKSTPDLYSFYNYAQQKKLTIGSHAQPKNWTGTLNHGLFINVHIYPEIWLCMYNQSINR